MQYDAQKKIVGAKQFRHFRHTPTKRDFVLVGAVTSDMDGLGITGVLMQEIAGNSDGEQAVFQQPLVLVPWPSFIAENDNGQVKAPVWWYVGLISEETRQNFDHFHESIYEIVDFCGESTFASRQANAKTPRPCLVSPCVINGYYRHYRNGKQYRILCVALNHSQDDERTVVYTTADSSDMSQVWTRSYNEFFALVTDDNGCVVPRFTLTRYGNESTQQL